MNKQKRMRFLLVVIPAVTVTLFLCVIAFVFISDVINNASLPPGDYGNADASKKQAALKYVGRHTGIDVSDGELYFGFDDHGGFHGDGTTYFEISMPESIDTVIAENGEWQSFPCQDMIVMSACKTGMDKHRGDYEDLIPEIKNGWYYYLDRTDGDPVGMRNFTIAAYDSDSRVLYFCKWDS